MKLQILSSFAILMFSFLTFAIAEAEQEVPANQQFLNAATQGNVEKVKEMLRTNPLLAKTTDDKGLSVILKATYYGKKDVVAAILASGVELDIFEASATGQVDRVKSITQKDPALANAFSTDGFTPLGLATFFGHPAAVNALLDAGAAVNTGSREAMRVTPLASAAAAKQIQIAKVLIARGANVNARAENDLTPLHEAAASGQIEFATLLLNSRANINAKTKDGKTPLAFARERKQTEMVELLRKFGATE
jgi:uncharacterized protein